MYKAVFLALSLIVIFALPSTAQERIAIRIGVATYSVPIPRGYKDVTEDAGAPQNVRVFETRAVEEWESASEYNERIVIVALTLPPESSAGFDAELADVFKDLTIYASSRASRREHRFDTSYVSQEFYDMILGLTHIENTQTAYITEDAPTQKAIMLSTSYEMPGVVTYPLVEEISLVRMDNIIFVMVVDRVAVHNNVDRQVRATGRILRDGATKISR